METPAENKTKTPKVKIVIPGAEHMTPEELKKAKHAEKMRRYMAKKRGKERGEIVDPGAEKKTGQEIRIMSNQELVDMSKDSRNLAMEVINMKLLDLKNDPEQLAKMNLATLATAFGILFDKSRLMEGLTTENIAIHQKVDINMTSDKALEELNKIRERYVGEHE